MRNIMVDAQPASHRSHAPEAGSVLPVSGENLHLKRGGRDVLNVDSISLSSVGCTVIVGPNGAGKSLLVRTLCDLQKPDTGRVTWGKMLPESAHRHKVGLLLQRPVLLHRSALANLVYTLRLLGHTRKHCKALARLSLEAAGLSSVESVQATRLSGGEEQRLALARALLLDPEVLFLDEATANVDPASTLLIERQLKTAIAGGLSVVMISHDIGQVRRMADHVLLMQNGRIVEHAHTTHFFEQSHNPLTRSWIAGELLV